MKRTVEQIRAAPNKMPSSHERLTGMMRGGVIQLRNGTYYRHGAPANDCIVGIIGEEDAIEQWLSEQILRDTDA